MKLRGSSIITAEEFVCFLKGEKHPYTHFSDKFNPGIQTILKQALVAAFRPVVDDEPVVEFFEDEYSLVVKVRGKWNDWLEGIAFQYIPPILTRLRTILNMKGFKQCKVQCSLHEKNPEKNNIRIIYNPKWRRYENFEIFFRNKTQSRRKVKRD